MAMSFPITFVIRVETYMIATRSFVSLFPSVMVSVVGPDGFLCVSLQSMYMYHAQAQGLPPPYRRTCGTHGRGALGGTAARKQRIVSRSGHGTRTELFLSNSLAKVDQC